MIRRWSYINIINLETNSRNFNVFEKYYNINLFKNLVSFKRFTFKRTKFKRKSFIRIKHKSQWLMYTNIIKFWILDYTFNKQYSKFQFFNKMFVNNFYFYNFNFIKNRNKLYFYNFNFFFSIISKKKFFFFHSNLFYYPLNNNISYAWTYKNPTISNHVIPLYSEWDSFLYLPQPLISNKNEFDLYEIFELLFSLSLTKHVEIKKILILLFYKIILQFEFKNVK